jgi:hypothetical protein
MKIVLDHNEWWILLYGDYRVKEPSYTVPEEVDIDVKKAIDAEEKAYSELTFNNSLLREHGYRERRLNHAAHESLREKLKNHD